MADANAGGGPGASAPKGRFADFAQKGAALLGEHWRAALLTVLLPVLATSETAFKAVVDSWTASCSIVVDVPEKPITQDSRHVFPIEVFVAGKAPAKAKLVLTAEKHLFDELRLSRKPQSLNVALHPQSGEVVKDAEARSIVFTLDPLSSVYSYYFIGVLANTPASASVRRSDFDALIQIDKVDGGTPAAANPVDCKVEQASLWNLTVGRNGWMRFVLFVAIVVALGSLVTILKTPRGAKP